MINDVLDLSKVDAGRLELTAENIAVDGLVDEVVDTLAPLARRTGATISVDVAPQEQGCGGALPVSGRFF